MNHYNINWTVSVSSMSSIPAFVLWSRRHAMTNRVIPLIKKHKSHKGIIQLLFHSYMTSTTFDSQRSESIRRFDSQLVQIDSLIAIRIYMSHWIHPCMGHMWAEPCTKLYPSHVFATHPRVPPPPPNPQAGFIGPTRGLCLPHTSALPTHAHAGFATQTSWTATSTPFVDWNLKLGTHLKHSDSPLMISD